MVLWGTVRVDFRSEKHSMAVDRSLDETDGPGFNGFDDGGLPTWFECVFGGDGAKSRFSDL